MKQYIAVVAILALLSLAVIFLFGNDVRGLFQSASTAEAPTLERTEKPRAERLREAHRGVAPKAVATDEPAQLSGVVKNRVTGAALENARVKLSDPSGRALLATTDKDGRFVFDVKSLGVHVLLDVSAQGFLAWEAPTQLWTLHGGDKIEGVTLLLTPALPYEGLVLDAQKKPVGGALVRVLGSDGAALESDARGHFVFSAHDDAVLEATHPRAGTGRAWVNRDVQITKKLTVVLDPARQPTPPRSVHGTVVDRTNGPIAGAVVEASPKDCGELAHFTRATTDQGGNFVLGQLDPCPYVLEAAAEGFVPHTEHVEATEAGPLRVTLHDACPVDLIIRGSNELVESSLTIGGPGPVPNTVRPTSVRVYVREDKGLNPDAMYESTVVPDGKGHATIAGFGPGNYRLELQANGFAPSVSPLSFSIDDGCGSVTLGAMLGRGYSFAGEVIEEGTNAPLPWALVSLEGLTGFEARTDEAGKFEMRGIARGLRSFHVAAGDHDARIVGPLEMSGANPARFERITLSKVKPGEAPKLELAGIGVGIAAKDDKLVVTNVLPEGGAQLAGIRIGDLITAIDDIPVGELGFDGSMQHIRGPVGTTVRMKLLRGGQASDITVTRVKIKA